MKYLIALAFIMAGNYAFLDQEIRLGVSWNWGHILGIHHEPLIVGCFAVAGGLIVWRIER